MTTRLHHLAIAALLSACRSERPDPLVGTWAIHGATLELRADGSLVKPAFVFPQCKVPQEFIVSCDRKQRWQRIGPTRIRFDNATVVPDPFTLESVKTNAPVTRCACEIESHDMELDGDNLKDAKRVVPWASAKRQTM
jgi:hypothetical protein